METGIPVLFQVAPLAGAWIETAELKDERYNWGRRPPRGGVD